MLFQGLNYRKGQSLALLCRNLWNYCRATAINCHQAGINLVSIMKVKLAFCMGKLRVKLLKTGEFPWYIPVLFNIGSDPPPTRGVTIHMKHETRHLTVHGLRDNTYCETTNEKPNTISHVMA